MTQTDPTREDLGAAWEPPKFALGVLVYAERDGEILLLKRAGETAFSGQWAPPGGAVDPGESPQEAAVRELKEGGLDVLEQPELVGCYLSRLYGHDFMTDEMLLELAGGNEGIAAGLRRLRADLDVYIRRISKEQPRE